MSKALEGKNVAILAADGFEQSELLLPKKALEDAGAKVEVVSLTTGEIKGWEKGNWAKPLTVDVAIQVASADDYDALMLPGGVINPDKLRSEEGAIQFVQEFVDTGKPIAAICHGPQTLIETGVLRGKRVTSYPSIRTDIINAGGEWEDNEVVVDNGLVTSRKPADIPAFCRKMIEEFAKGPQDTSVLGLGEQRREHPKHAH
ncbi:type 1 glutamine amidotransferase domain-containing protein [Bdellovibrio sp. HCB288]|uniref:type 1 glutamine amidotransferase domain-containing protein n=1 Tax=Bdellovibrio sp. HCB288 TaxID=3394355 RepID=UPI0039B607A7